MVSNRKILGADSKLMLCPQRNILFRLLALALGSPAAFDSLSLRPVNVMRRNPAFIVRFRARGHGRSISSNHRDLVRGIDFL